MAVCGEACADATANNPLYCGDCDVRCSSNEVCDDGCARSTSVKNRKRTAEGNAKTLHDNPTTAAKHASGVRPAGMLSATAQM